MQTFRIEVKDEHFDLTIKFSICHTPARTFLKCVVGHMACKRCERCDHIDHIKTGVTVFFQKGNPRSDEKFRSFSDTDYHNGVSMLIKMNSPIDNICQSILDPMDLLY